jgi:hypothetical protein
MKEKRILIAVLLSMVFQAEAVRSPLQGSADKDASEKMPKKEKKDYKKESSSSKEKSKSKKAVKYSAGTQGDMPHRVERKKESDDKSKSMSRVEREDKKKKDEEKKQEEIRSKKRAELEKSIKKIEKTIDDLESKKSEELTKIEEEEEDRDKEPSRSHIVNHGSVKIESLDKQLQDQREMLARKEEALVKLSDDTRENKQDELNKRTALAKMYDNTQKDLREKLKKVREEIQALRVEEMKAKNELEDDRAGYEQHIIARRSAETMHDSAEAEAHGKMLYVKESDEMKALRAREKRVRKDLDGIGKKIDQNADAREKAAKEAGIKLSLRKERRATEVDRMIKEGVRPEDNHSRLFTETAVEIKQRKEDVAAMAKKSMGMRRPAMEKGSMKKPSSRSMKKDMDMMSKKGMMPEKKVVRETRPVSEAARDLSLIEDEDQE